jgi:hypothetical protein
MSLKSHPVAATTHSSFLNKKKRQKKGPWKGLIISNFMIYDYWSSLSQKKKPQIIQKRR